MRRFARKVIIGGNIMAEEKVLNIYQKLQQVQSQLKAPKGQKNKFGNYMYRSCEDILEAVKPVLNSVKALIIVDDEVKLVGDRYYIKSTATFINIEDGEKLSASASARESEIKKGMDSSQITGTASSYARKYALNGLLLIDDTKDSDTDENHKQTNKTEKTVIQDSLIKQNKDLDLKLIAVGVDINSDIVKNYLNETAQLTSEPRNNTEMSRLIRTKENTLGKKTKKEEK
jgi:hypothetical protein